MHSEVDHFQQSCSIWKQSFVIKVHISPKSIRKMVNFTIFL